MMRDAMDRGEDKRVDAGQAAGRRVERRNCHRSTRELVIGQHVRERQGVENLPVRVDRMYQPATVPLSNVACAVTSSPGIAGQGS